MVKVFAQMEAEHRKHRVTFYYLLAETSDNIAKLVQRSKGPKVQRRKRPGLTRHQAFNHRPLPATHR